MCSCGASGSSVDTHQEVLSCTSGSGAAGAPAAGLQLPAPVRCSTVASTFVSPDAAVDANELILDDESEDEADTDSVASNAAVGVQASDAHGGDCAPESKKARTECWSVPAVSKMSLPPPKHS